MSFSLLKIFRVTLATVLGLWVAGAGCLLGCEGMMSAMASEASGAAQPAVGDLNLVVSGDACATAKSHDCCAKQKNHGRQKAQTAERQTGALMETDATTSGMSECPLAMTRTVVAAKNAGGETSSATIIAPANLPAQNLLEQNAPLVAQVRLPNRGHTYLRCCSLLI